LTKFLENNEVDFVVNIWVYGYKEWLSDDESIRFQKISDYNLIHFIQIARIFNLVNKKELIVPQVLEFGKLESIVCS
jgi:hypothetical protein